METFLATDEVNEAVDAMADAATVEPDERLAFAEAARDFTDTRADRAAELPNLEDTPPTAVITALQAEYVMDGETDRAAAVQTALDYLKWHRGEQAKLN